MLKLNIAVADSLSLMLIAIRAKITERSNHDRLQRIPILSPLRTTEARRL
jgi:hypothetical protein